jgi:hypothetical protein
VTKYIDPECSQVVGALFSDQAGKIIADASVGIPRAMNSLCDAAVAYAFAAGAKTIDAKRVKSVIENKAEFGVLPLLFRAEDQPGGRGAARRTVAGKPFGCPPDRSIAKDLFAAHSVKKEERFLSSF